MKKLFACLLSFAMIFALSASFLSAYAVSRTVTGSNWMSAADGSAPITSLTVPGTHGSATQYVTAPIISRTQSLSVAEQLRTGVRYLDICLKKTETGFAAVNGTASCKSDGSIFAEDLTASKLIEYCRDFLQSNPTETVLFRLTENGDGNKAFFTSFYELYIKNSRELWFTENRIPLLDEVRGKIILLRTVGADAESFDDSDSGINFQLYPDIDSREQYDYRRCNITKLEGEAYTSMYIQDSYKLEGDRKWNAVSNFLGSDLSSESFNICYTSCADGSTPQFNAQDINSRLMQYDFQKGKAYGIIAVDFAEKDLCERIYTVNAYVEAARPAETSTVTAQTVPNETVSTTAVRNETAAAAETAKTHGSLSEKESTESRSQPEKAHKPIAALPAAVLIFCGSAVYIIIRKKSPL